MKLGERTGSPITCATCGAEFYRNPASKPKYCSRPCYEAGKRASNTKPCKVCGKVFYHPHWQTVYCSMACSAVRRRIPRTCRTCGGTFFSHKPKQKFCGRACVPHMVADTPQQRSLRLELGWSKRWGDYRLDIQRTPLWGNPFLLIDLVHPHAKLAIEVDGESHRKPDQIDRDRRKETILRSLGWEVIRFSNSAIYRDTAAVAEKVLAVVDQRLLQLKPAKSRRSSSTT